MKERWIALEGVWCTFGSDNPVHALRGVDLTIDRGEFVVVGGRSGSGKSTLLYIVGGIRSPTRGHRTILGVEDPGPRELTELRRRRIGFVFQNFHLLSHLSAAENIEMGGRYGRLSFLERRRRAVSLLDLVGLGDRAEHRPGALSGGEQQRVAIARSLVNDPELILADEPTGNLDSEIGRRILELLGQIARSGTTVLVVSHSTEVGSRADRLLTLRDGSFVQADHVAG